MTSPSPDIHATDAPSHAGAVAHAANDHGGDHGGDQGHGDHGHGADTLGPVDGLAWGAGAIGILLGLVVAACFALATGAISVV